MFVDISLGIVSTLSPKRVSNLTWMCYKIPHRPGLARNSGRIVLLIYLSACLSYYLSSIYSLSIWYGVPSVPEAPKKPSMAETESGEAVRRKDHVISSLIGHCKDFAFFPLRDMGFTWESWADRWDDAIWPVFKRMILALLLWLHG